MLCAQVPDAAVSALALAYHVMAPAITLSPPSRPGVWTDSSEAAAAVAGLGSYTMNGGGVRGDPLSPLVSRINEVNAAAEPAPKLLLACGTKPRELHDRGRYTGGGYGAMQTHHVMARGPVRRGRPRGAGAAGANGDDDFFGGRMVRQADGKR